MKGKIKGIILKLLLVVGIVGIIAVSTYFILRACGFTTVDDFIRLRNDLGDSIGFWAIIVLLQIVQSIFIPISNSLISAPVSFIFTNEIWKVFLASWLGITIGNIALYYIGRLGGGKLLKFVLGDETTANKLKSFMGNGKSFYILAGLIPFIPSDVVNVIAGLVDYNALFVIVCTIITRGICCATTCWLVGLIPQYPFMIAILCVLIVFMVFMAIIVTKKSIKKAKDKENQKQAENCPYFIDKD